MSHVAHELTSLKTDMLNLLDDMEAVLDSAPSDIRNRAKSYWMAHVRMALTKEHEFLGGSMTDCEDTIVELEEQNY